ncbi:hypothetical protein GWI33_015597 [Rhynchophorus ferrugineus]|uniref:Uncharacterized protein n=1 Tax=Rhynchophorus ferrugineus TaxID=354439 RepID=A0A834I2Z3_RHYFE|nr:hypothetical protein GWI33_015597 [Rhynchophorus ferrugineus]
MKVFVPDIPLSHLIGKLSKNPTNVQTRMKPSKFGALMCKNLSGLNLRTIRLNNSSKASTRAIRSVGIFLRHVITLIYGCRAPSPPEIAAPKDAVPQPIHDEFVN